MKRITTATLLTTIMIFSNSCSIDNERHSLSRIAHAGGGYKNWQNTNSLDALEFNKDHYDLFEIDLSWTSDGNMACIHDWKTTAEWIFGKRFSQPPTLEEFEQLVAKNPYVKSCTLQTLTQWFEKHPKKKLVTDIKANNLKGLKMLRETLKSPGEQIIAQIYSPEEYSTVRAMGYRHIIWTLYRYPHGTEKVLAHAKNMDLYAITMPRKLAEQGLAERLLAIGTPSYTHTINTQRELNQFREFGIREIYTDWLSAH